MANPCSSVLTEALLAAAEHACRAAHGQEAAAGNVYDERGGVAAEAEQETSAEEKKKWPI